MHPIAAGECGPTPNSSDILMHCKTPSEIRRWLSGQGMHHRPLESGVPLAGDFEMPHERRSRLLLADHLADLVAKDGNKLVEVQPSPQGQAEEWEALAQFRARHGVAQALPDAPGHFFKSGDRDDFRMLVTMLLGFESKWSFYVYSAPSHSTLLLNGRVGVWSPKKGLRNELGRYLAESQAA